MKWTKLFLTSNHDFQTEKHIVEQRIEILELDDLFWESLTNNHFNENKSKIFHIEPLEHEGLEDNNERGHQFEEDVVQIVTPCFISTPTYNSQSGTFSKNEGEGE